ncbi:MAG: aminopeptidase [Candidatus Roizmanbacteria bacterium]|nr:MAG: aminopeptidase [Candidatus Roizmanbacteria bacterium]
MQPATRDIKLARILIHHSLKLKAKECILITISDFNALPLVKAVFIEALKTGAYPVVDTQINPFMNRGGATGLRYQFYKLANDWQLNYIPSEILEAQMKWANAYVRIVTIDNTQELNQIAQEKITTTNKLVRPFLDKMIDKDRWVLTYYPTPSMAQNASVSLDWLLDFYYKSCIVDYDKMKKQLTKIEKVLDDGSIVRIVGKDTDLTFSIKGRLAKASYGERNIPDGEVFLAPVFETIEGKVYFDLPTNYNGADVSDIHLEFEKGKVVKATSKVGNKAMQKILDTDPGARTFGELGIGVNYQIKNAMRNTLFDEKIGGTIHLALGSSYKEKRGGAPVGFNKSAIHWDIVKDMRKKGSILYVDDKVLMKEGKFSIGNRVG